MSQTSKVPNPLRPSGAGDGSSCDRRECAEWDSPAGQGCPEVSENLPAGSFEGLRVQPCSLRFREPPMPGRKPRSRHAEPVPFVLPRRVGRDGGRRVRDVPHRCSRKGSGGQRTGFSSRVRERRGIRDSGFRTGQSFMPECGARRRGNTVALP